MDDEHEGGILGYYPWIWLEKDEENLSQENQSHPRFELGTSKMQVRYVTAEKTCSIARFHLPVLNTKVQYILTDGTTLHNKMIPKVTCIASKEQ